MLAISCSRWILITVVTLHPENPVSNRMFCVHVPHTGALCHRMPSFRSKHVYALVYVHGESLLGGCSTLCESTNFFLIRSGVRVVGRTMAWASQFVATESAVFSHKWKIAHAQKRDFSTSKRHTCTQKIPELEGATAHIVKICAELFSASPNYLNSRHCLPGTAWQHLNQRCHFGASY